MRGDLTLLGKLLPRRRPGATEPIEHLAPHTQPRTVAVLIAGSPTRAFYSQVGALSLALRKLEWTRWQPTVHLFLGGDPDLEAFAAWRPFLSEVDIVWSCARRFDEQGNWAQCDEVMRLAPRDADVILTLDADVLPVSSFEGLLDEVAETDTVAGVIAHYPFVGAGSPADWQRLAAGLIEAPLDFGFEYTLLDAPAAQRATPFYVNFGFVAFSRSAYNRIVLPYLDLRPQVEKRLENPFFSAQVALALAIAETRVRTWALPMKYNFPNDPVAEQLYPRELAEVVAFHYLRTDLFDRQEIFAAPASYANFLSLPLRGVNDAFRSAVASIFGADYPFHRTGLRDSAAATGIT